MKPAGPLRTLIVVVVAQIFVTLIAVLVGDRRLHSGVVAKLRAQLLRWPARRFDALIGAVEATDRLLMCVWGSPEDPR